jgi:hypothetical protein
MATKTIEETVHELVADLRRRLVADALAHTQAALASYSPFSPTTLAQRAKAPLRRLPSPAPRVNGPIRAADYVERLVEIVKNHPWPPQSRELQALLGVRKDPFLRVVTVAMATGRIVRTGQKAGMRYHLAP